MLARWQVLIAALLFSTGGAAVKSCSFSSWQIASFRCGLAAFILLLILPEARKAWNRKTLLVGCAYAATLNLYVLANKTTTAANAIFLQGTAPIYVLLIAPLWLKEKNRRHDPWIVVLMAIGLATLLLGDEVASQTAPAPVLGNLLGVAAGICWALTVMGLRAIGKDSDQTVSAVVIGNLLAFLSFLPMALPVSDGRGEDWLWIVYLGAFQVALAYFFLTRAVRFLPALETALLLLLEPVLSPIWAWWLHREQPSFQALVGGAIIVGATLLKAWLDAGATRTELNIPPERT